MDAKEWQNRLTENFAINDSGALYQIYGVEDNCGRYITNKFHGYIALIDSFQSFYIETIQSAYSWVMGNGWPKNYINYAPILAYFVNLFRSFRACENLFMKGYPLDGYALLRDLKDRAIFMAAIARNITTFNAIFGLTGLNNVTMKEGLIKVRDKVRKERKIEEFKVLNKMIRKESGLPSEIITELDIWERLFHEEVHGSKLSYVIELKDWIEKGVSFQIGPSPNESAMAIYMNRSCEIGWLIIRLFPYLQVEENAFDDKWHEKYEILDDSFRFMQKELSGIGKKIGDAFIFFVDSKFTFKSPFYYSEANETG